MLKPLGDRVVIRVLEQEEKTAIMEFIMNNLNKKFFFIKNPY